MKATIASLLQWFKGSSYMGGFCALFTLMCASAPAQITKPARNYVETIMTPSHVDRNYHVGEAASISLLAYAGGAPVDGVVVYYEHGPEMLYSVHTDSVTFRNGRADIPLGTMNEPGFLACKYRFQLNGRNYRDLVKLAFDADSIRSYAQEPHDFDKFWKRTLREASRAPFDVKLYRREHLDSEKSSVWLVELTVGPSGRKMFGYLSKPKAPGPHPVLFYPPGAGTKKIVSENLYSDAGFICLKVEIHGLNPELPDSVYNRLRSSLSNYNVKGLPDRDQFYYRSVYAGCSRCIDWLCTLPDWDGRNVLVTGGSQGGALTVVSAALNPKVTALACFYPALNDLTAFRHRRAGGWPKYFSTENYATPIAYNQQEKAAQMLQYFDVTNFARKLHQPGFYNFGYGDNTCGPTSIWGMLNAISAPKTVVITPTSAHWRFSEVNDESISWMMRHLK